MDLLFLGLLDRPDSSLTCATRPAQTDTADAQVSHIKRIGASCLSFCADQSSKRMGSLAVPVPFHASLIRLISL